MRVLLLLLALLATGARAAIPPEPTVYPGTPVTLDVWRVPLRDVLRRLVVDEGELGLLVESGAAARPVSLRVRDRPWDEVLSRLLEREELAQALAGWALIVAPEAVLGREEPPPPDQCFGRIVPVGADPSLVRLSVSLGAMPDESAPPPEDAPWSWLSAGVFLSEREDLALELLQPDWEWPEGRIVLARVPDAEGIVVRATVTLAGGPETVVVQDLAAPVPHAVPDGRGRTHALLLEGGPATAEP